MTGLSLFPFLRSSALALIVRAPKPAAEPLEGSILDTVSSFQSVAFGLALVLANTLAQEEPRHAVALSWWAKVLYLLRIIVSYLENVKYKFDLPAILPSTRQRSLSAGSSRASQSLATLSRQAGVHCATKSINGMRHSLYTPSFFSQPHHSYC